MFAAPVDVRRSRRARESRFRSGGISPLFIDDLDSAELGGSGVLLYSGGADSTLLAHSLIRRGKRLIALSVDYPGRPAAEIATAKRIAGRVGFTEHLTIGLDLPWHPLRGEARGKNEGWVP